MTQDQMTIVFAIVCFAIGALVAWKVWTVND